MSKKEILTSAIKELLERKIDDKKELMAEKRKIAKKYGLPILRNSDILGYLKNIKGHENLLPILRKRSIRTMSGIAPVAVLTKPFPCPGKCAYCPTEKNVPQSYLSNEPAVMRAIRCNYDPYLQVQYRLKALEANGHEPTKIELIVIGGTWSVLPEGYKFWYIKQCFRAANNYGKKILNSKLQITNKFQISKLKNDLLIEQKKNEKAKYKIIGLTLETRPDYINEKELWEMRELGCTRVELGVQAVDDKILEKNLRGHGVGEIAEATKMLKDFGFKVTYHVMPGLPGSTPKKDVSMFKKLFNDERFQPDQIKFYPTVVTKGSLMHEWWQDGLYKPYTTKQLEDLIIACKKEIPEYVRVIRLIRDIPEESIVAGNIVTNLRQVMQQRGVKCNCIRCREAGERKIINYKLQITNYRASGGEEFFIQAVNKKDNTLYGFCRLRLSHNAQRVTRNFSVIPASEPGSRTALESSGGKFSGFRVKHGMTKKESYALRDYAIIRELHVYGELVSVGAEKKVQHSGLGKKLMLAAERIAKKNKYAKIAVISGIGARGYYKKLKYKLKNTYMAKDL